MTEKTGDDIALTKRSVKRIMREECERVSDDAAIRLAAEAERFIKNKTRAAKVIAESDERKTVREADMRAAQQVQTHMDKIE